MLKPLILWGATGQAIVLAEFAERIGFRIVALFDNDLEVRSPLPSVELHPGASFEAWRDSAPAEIYGLVAIGGEHGAARLELAARLRRAKVELAIAVHPAAYVARDAELAEGAQILAGAIVAARARIRSCAILNTGASVDHQSQIGQGAHIGPGAVLAGCVEVGDRAFVGTGAVVLPRVRIGADAIVGAGAVVTSDVAAQAVVAGVPARLRRYRE